MAGEISRLETGKRQLEDVVINKYEVSHGKQILTAEASRRDFAKLRDSEDWDILLPDQKRTIIAAAFGFP